VHSDNSDWTKRAKEILERTGAEDISSTGETKGDMENTDKPRPRYETTSAAASANRDRDPVELDVVETERIVASEPDANEFRPERPLRERDIK